MQYDTTSNYHKKMFLKLHCPLCRYRRISGRLHVECFRNPKHKQLEYMDTRLLWDDPRDTVFAGGYHKFKQLPPDEIERRKHTGYRKMLRKAYREKEAQRNAQQK
uniref:39S ribosomal protein L36, mitochondrial n=1 Tax=Acrobeloides nanus TaxID=290746 RepID=A0A914DRX5_9BILA